jgi:hypothetical protein
VHGFELSRIEFSHREGACLDRAGQGRHYARLSEQSGADRTTIQAMFSDLAW